MIQAIQEFLFLPISIGSFVFLLQKTDFVYEYFSLFSRTFGLKNIDSYLKFEYYEKNSSQFQNYISFLGSIYGVRKNILGFFCRLISCFLCLSCFLSLVFVILLYKSMYLVFPCFVISVLIYLILFTAMKKIYE
jgi:hypothetical protein